MKKVVISSMVLVMYVCLIASVIWAITSFIVYLVTGTYFQWWSLASILFSLIGLVASIYALVGQRAAEEFAAIEAERKRIIDSPKKHSVFEQKMSRAYKNRKS